MTQDERFMKEALAEAEQALAMGEVPVGAVAESAVAVTTISILSPLKASVGLAVEYLLSGSSLFVAGIGGLEILVEVARKHAVV